MLSDTIPFDRCDERFTGYGANKAACLFEMYLSGVSFYVLADHFLIHQSHTYEEEARREEVCYPYIFTLAIAIANHAICDRESTIGSYMQISKMRRACGAWHHDAI